jgi:hypothetical protein
VARKTIYTNAKIAELCPQICSRIAEGESLNRICKEGGMPSKGEFLGWVLADIEAAPGGVADQYARARQLQAEGWAEQIVDVSDAATDRDSAQVAKVRIDARKWVAAKLIPKKYGDRIDVTSGGEKMQAGVLVVPGVAAGEDWTKAAAAQQKALEGHARDAGESGK